MLSATLWAAGSVGLVTLVAMWAFDLGSRNPADIPALSAEAPWRRAPENVEGRRIPGAEAQVYGAMSDERGAAAPAVAEAFGAPEAERPTEADLLAAAEAPPPLSEIATDQGQPVSREAFEQMAMAAAAEAEAGGRRTILLDDPVEPLRTAEDFQGSGAPDVPENIGVGSETPPPNAVFYSPDAAVADAAARQDGAPAAAGGSDAALEVAPPAPEPKLAEPGPPQGDERLAEAAATVAPPPAGLAAAEEAPEGAPELRDAASAAPGDDASDGASEGEEAQVASASTATPLTQRSRTVAAPPIYQVQLGALDSVRAVEAEWAELQAKSPSLLGDFKLDVQPVNVGGARLYRLRVGAFASRTEAAQLCARLRAEGIECFPASG